LVCDRRPERFVLAVILISIGSLHTRHGDPARAAGFLGEAIDYWSRAGNWTQQWIAIRHVIDLLIRLDAHEQAAVLYGALTTSPTATTAYGPDATRLRAHGNTLRRTLGPDNYSAVLARGATTNDDATIQLARAELARILTTHDQHDSQ
jgi:hypothetical protein